MKKYGLVKIILNYNWGRELDEDLVKDDFVISTTEHFIRASSLEKQKLKIKELQKEEERLCRGACSIGVNNIVPQRGLTPYRMKIEAIDGEKITREIGISHRETYGKGYHPYEKICEYLRYWISNWNLNKKPKKISIEEIIDGGYENAR